MSRFLTIVGSLADVARGSHREPATEDSLTGRAHVSGFAEHVGAFGRTESDDTPPMIRTTLFAVILPLLATAGCTINGPNDALTGTWTNTSCYGSPTMPADIQSCSTSVEFGADLSVTVVDSRQAQPATAMYPRCTITRRATGQQYSTSNGTGSLMTVTITGQSTSTIERTGCANATDNAAPAADTFNPIPAGVAPYQISTNMLTISAGSLAGSYTRSVL